MEEAVYFLPDKIKDLVELVQLENLIIVEIKKNNFNFFLKNTFFQESNSLIIASTSSCKKSISFPNGFADLVKV